MQSSATDAFLNKFVLPNMIKSGVIQDSYAPTIQRLHGRYCDPCLISKRLIAIKKGGLMTIWFGVTTA